MNSDPVASVCVSGEASEWLILGAYPETFFGEAAGCRIGRNALGGSHIEDVAQRVLDSLDDFLFRACV